MNSSKTVLKKISLNSAHLSLWSQNQIDDPVYLSAQSVLPQLKLTPALLNKLWNSSHKPGSVIKTFKYSPQHLLSLEAQDVDELQSSPSDFPIYLTYSLKDAFISRALRSIERKINKPETLQPLDLCRIFMQSERKRSTLVLKTHLVFPYTDLEFTPISPLKIVSTPLSKQLIRASSDPFSMGFVTLDKSGRALPLLLTDPMSYKYPLVGIWLANIPEQPRQSPMSHSLVWSSCLYYIENSSIRERISSLEDGFLVINFGSRPRFYECKIDQAYWCRTSTVSEIQAGEFGFDQFFLSFMRGERRKRSVNGRPPMSSSPVPRNRSYSPEVVINEQQQMLYKLQAQVQELQMHLMKKNKVSASMGDLNLKQSEVVRMSVETNCTEPSIHVPKIVCENTQTFEEEELVHKIQEKYLG